MKIIQRGAGYRPLSRAVHLLVSIFTPSRRKLFLMGATTFVNKPLGLLERFPQVRPPSEQGFPCAGASLRCNSFDSTPSGLCFVSLSDYCFPCVHIPCKTRGSRIRRDLKNPLTRITLITLQNKPSMKTHPTGSKAKIH